MTIPAIIYLVLSFMGLLISAHDHGKDKTGKYNFFVNLFATSIMFGLLYWGGFFK